MTTPDLVSFTVRVSGYTKERPDAMETIEVQVSSEPHLDLWHELAAAWRATMPSGPEWEGWDDRKPDDYNSIFWIDDEVPFPEVHEFGAYVTSSKRLTVHEFAQIFGPELAQNPSAVRVDLEPAVGGSPLIVDVYELLQQALGAWGVFSLFWAGWKRASEYGFETEREDIRDWQATPEHTAAVERIVWAQGEWAYKDVKKRWALTLTEASSLFAATGYELTRNRPDYVWADPRD